MCVGGGFIAPHIYETLAGYAEHLFHIWGRMLWITDKRDSGKVESERIYGTKEKKKSDALAEG